MTRAVPILSPRQLKGLDRIGDAFIPGDEDLPSFSATGCRTHAGRILAYLDEPDRRDLQTALTVLSLLPGPVVRRLPGFLEWSQRLPGPLGALIRMGRVGLKGLIVSLYYSGETGPEYNGPSPLDVLGYQAAVVRDEGPGPEDVGSPDRIVLKRN
jgi:hypothetical protein